MMSFEWPVVGHSRIIDYLQSAIQKNNLSHGYFFYGVEHLGKKTVAKFFAKSISCSSFHQTEIVPCQKCTHCRSFDNNIHPDLLIIKPEINKKTGKLKKNISIDQIRKVQEVVGLRSFLNNYKIVIIEQADKLSLGAFNSLLKILEEPPKKTIFILIANSTKDVPKTILSRCQQIKFLPVAYTAIYNFLVKEKEVSRTLAINIASMVFGKPGLINSFLEEDILKNHYNQIEENINLMNAPEYQRLLAVEKMLPKSIEAEEQKKVSASWLKTWELIIRDSLLLKINDNNSDIRYVSNLYLEQIKNSFDRYSTVDMIKLLSTIKMSKLYLSSNISPRLVLENFIISFNI
jgi:DNA polymerase-3 subunit delta'